MGHAEIDGKPLFSSTSLPEMRGNTWLFALPEKSLKPGIIYVETRRDFVESIISLNMIGEFSGKKSGSTPVGFSFQLQFAFRKMSTNKGYLADDKQSAEEEAFITGLQCQDNSILRACITMWMSEEIYLPPPTFLQTNRENPTEKSVAILTFLFIYFLVSHFFASFKTIRGLAKFCILQNIQRLENGG